ncbi:hypothetical protein PZ892_00280 [Sphingobacterium sp. WM]|uniref:hypothetical protein n=1 Tax=Sphingobacterium sp. WM TaxID=3031802 RepID=UPI00240E6578|nr:hypothetical protein [Sphingobacterium sp. WM]WFB63657.1 hypothetical protein PZ892_00280 [Sphingobacterium sp. WM]
MIKNYSLGLLAFILLLGSCNNSSKTASAEQDTVTRASLNKPEEIQQISEVITRFARAYLSQDNEKVNALIHPEHGLAVIYRPGVMDDFKLVDSFDIRNPVPAHYPYTTFENDKTLTFESLPEFQCDTDKWTKYGFMSDTTKTSVTHLLDTIMKYQGEYNEVKYDEATLKKVSILEDGSYRVILNPTDEHFLIFHVKQFEGSWFVTLLDRSYGNCDA